MRAREPRLGLLSNARFPKGIPLITPPKKAPKPEEFVPAAKAHDLWGGGGSFFPGRAQAADFEAGHIANALNLPAEEFAGVLSEARADALAGQRHRGLLRRDGMRAEPPFRRPTAAAGLHQRPYAFQRLDGLAQRRLTRSSRAAK